MLVHFEAEKHRPRLLRQFWRLSRQSHSWILPVLTTTSWNWYSFLQLIQENDLSRNEVTPTFSRPSYETTWSRWPDIRSCSLWSETVQNKNPTFNCLRSSNFRGSVRMIFPTRPRNPWRIPRYPNLMIRAVITPQNASNGIEFKGWSVNSSSVVSSEQALSSVLVSVNSWLSDESGVSFCVVFYGIQHALSLFKQPLDIPRPWNHY